MKYDLIIRKQGNIFQKDMCIVQWHDEPEYCCKDFQKYINSKGDLYYNNNDKVPVFYVDRCFIINFCPFCGKKIEFELVNTKILRKEKKKVTYEIDDWVEVNEM